MDDWVSARGRLLGTACHEAACFASIILLQTAAQGRVDDTLAKTAASLPVQRFYSLDNRHVGRTSDTRARRPVRLHVELGRVLVTDADLQANSLLNKETAN